MSSVQARSSRVENTDGAGPGAENSGAASTRAATIRAPSRRRVLLACAVACAVVASGCVRVTTLEGESLRATSPEFRAYVERVFRAQNRSLSALAFALEDVPVPAETATDTALVAAEERLLEACAELNELATRRRDDQRLGLSLAARTARAAPRCEAAAQAADDLLAERADSGARSG